MTLQSAASDLSLLEAGAREAGALVRELLAKPLEIQSKGEAGPVTNIDFAVNDLLMERLRSARPDYGWLSVFVLLQAARIWVLHTLGTRWTTRVIVPPDKAPIRTGPYRFLSHPNYAVVAAEIFVLPMVFGLIFYALLFSVLNALVLAVRIRAEDTALRGSGAPSPS